MSFERTVAYPKEACTICLDLLTEDVWDHGKKGHLFHGKCIAKWVDMVPDCPICRASVDKTSFLGYDTLLDQDDEDDDDDLFDFPKEWNGVYLIALIGGASIPIYDLIYYSNFAALGAVATLGTALIVRKIS